jgi:hypothetical protein
MFCVQESPALEGYRNKCEFTIGFHPDTLKLTVGFRLGQPFPIVTQDFGSGSGSWSGSRRAKMTHKSRKKIKKFHVYPQAYRRFQARSAIPFVQGFGSGSVLDPDSIRSVDLDPYSESRSGSGSRRAKMTHKSRKKLRNFMVWSAGCSLLRAEGFFCSLDVLYGGLGIGK